MSNPVFWCNSAESAYDKLTLRNMPIQIYWEFYHQKMKNSGNFHISAQNIDCGYLLEPPGRGGSNKYQRSMFLSRNKKNNVYPCKP